MQKSIDKGPELQIRSAVALDHLKNYIYIEADKEAHVKEVISAWCKHNMCWIVWEYEWNYAVIDYTYLV